MAVQAIAKGVRLSPRKVSVVAALVRGRSVEDALIILEHTPRRSATGVAKLCKAPGPTPTTTTTYKPDTLQITEISVTQAHA